jgi:DNA adenine methylase
MTNQAIKSPVMRYHGGKFRLAPWIISFFPEHTCYVEPYGGAAGVLMQKERSYSEVYNDLDGEIVNVFRVLQDNKLSEQLIESCVLTPFPRDEFKLSYEKSSDPVEQARRTLFRSEAGFGSGGSTGHNTGFRSDSKRAYSLASHIWQKYPERIKAFGERLAGVIIENRPAIDVIKANDSEDTLFFIDPPYVLDTRVLSRGNVYRCEMTDDDHVQLLETIKQLKGYVVLSGYDHPIYKDMLSEWENHSKRARISSGRGTGIRHEQVWLSPSCASVISQPDLLAMEQG